MKCMLIRGLRASQAFTAGMLVGGVVVGDDVQLHPRVALGDEFEEVQELRVGVALIAGVGHLPGGDLERGEQAGGAVPDVVVGSFSGRPGRIGRIGAVRSSA